MVHVYLVDPHLDGPSLSSQCRPPRLWPLALVHGPLPLSIPCDSQADAACDGVVIHVAGFAETVRDKGGHKRKHWKGLSEQHIVTTSGGQSPPT